MTLPERFLSLTLVAGMGGCALVAQASDFPPPGEYQIDTETTRRLSSPTGVVESIERVDGATGSATLTHKAPGMAEPVVTRVPGSGPVRHCQGVAGPPPAGANCQARREQGPGQTTVDMQCAGHRLVGQFRQVGDGVWEQRYQTSLPGAGGMTVDSLQRWTRLSAHCSGKR